VSYNALYRPLKDGKDFNSLFPTPNGNRIRLGKGDTHTSIELIIKWALENNHEVNKVVTKLQKSSLSETCLSIHDFLYNHFQYKADGEAQLLRSPAYAWKYRHEGIDCKSYSIIASCILLQLGVVHYIRKIKQPTFAPESFTHVYIIVPVNQTTGSLNQGYYTIDGTLENTIEPNYIDKKDFFMDKLAHYGLNGVATKQGLNGFDFNDVKQYLSTPISCWGGSGFTGSQASETAVIIGSFFEKLLTNINLAVKTNNVERLTELDHNFNGYLRAGLCGYDNKRREGWNDCTEDSIGAMQNILDFYQKVVWVGYDAWINKYFNVTDVSTMIYTNENIELEPTKFKFAFTSPACEKVVKIRRFQLKQGVTQIPEFEFTPYIQEVASNPSSFDVNKFLQGLSTVLVSFNGNGTGTVDENGQIIYDEQNTPKTTNAGMGYLFGGLALTGLAVWGFSKMKNTGKGTTKTAVKK
jgi:hypothetical protein